MKLGENYSMGVIGKQIMSQIVVPKIILQKKIFFESFNYSNVSLIMELIPTLLFQREGSINIMT